MIKEHLICVKQILDKIISYIYKSVLYCIVFSLLCGVIFLFLYPYYNEYIYKKNCQKSEYSKIWCEQTWLELEELN